MSGRQSHEPLEKFAQLEKHVIEKETALVFLAEDLSPGLPEEQGEAGHHRQGGWYLASWSSDKCKISYFREISRAW